MNKTISKILILGLVVGAAFAPNVVDAKKKKQKPINRIVELTVAHGYADTEDSPDGYVNIPGASAKVKTAANGMILIRFSAETRCSSSENGYCSVRALVDGNEADPIDAAGAYFDSTGGGGWQNRMVERSVHSVDKGDHEVVIQWATYGGSNPKFEMGAWHLTVESVK
jgi:hypothetical protein